MPATNPRIHVVLEKPLFKVIEHMANKDGVSLSLKVRDLIKEAVDNYYEDLTLFGIARSRAKTFSRSKALSHESVWHTVKKKYKNKSLIKKLESLKGEPGRIYTTPSEAKAHLNKLIKK